MLAEYMQIGCFVYTFGAHLMQAVASARSPDVMAVVSHDHVSALTWYARYSMSAIMSGTYKACQRLGTSEVHFG